MKSKGFTLIELLAVIVILAIIALIATPIILNIIEDAKSESNERSVEMYAKAIQNSIAKSQLNSNETITGTFTTEDGKTLEQEGTTKLTVEYDGDKVVCEKIEIYEDGNIYLLGCGIGTTGDYTYGEKQVTQVYKPRFYGDWSFRGTVGTTTAPETPSEEPPIGKNFYLGYDVEGGVVSTVYVCFKSNETEYCLKGHDGSSEVFEKNKTVLNDGYEVSECSENYGCSGSNADDLQSNILEDGSVFVSNGVMICNFEYGNFGCSTLE